MELSQLVLTVNTAGTLAIGAICFFIVYTTFRGIQDQKIQEFSKRFLMAIAVLILYVSYFMVYNTFLTDIPGTIYILYLILVAVFIYMIYAAVAFERIAESYGLSSESKIEKMENEELGN